MRITKLLALVAVMVVAAACNGISPITPTTVGSDDAAALVSSEASTASVSPKGSECRNITKVTLRVTREADTIDFAVRATYFNGNVPSRCTIPPQWSSRGRGRLAATLDPFVVKVILRSPLDRFQVTAQAPNGVRGRIAFPLPAAP